jgi:hypothetical protein
MLRKYQLKNVGEVHTTNEGYKLTIIGGGSKSGYCLVQFESPRSFLMEVKYCHVKSGGIKNPYHPVHYEVGYFGVGNYTSDHPAHSVWRNMVKRCYSSALAARYPTYKNVTVCVPWLNYQNFAKWYADHDVQGWHLDKDLLSGQTKEYSPETCCFIPQEINAFMTNEQSTNTSGSIGVTWASDRNKWRVSIGGSKSNQDLGQFNCFEEATQTYMAARQERAKALQLKYKALIPHNILTNIK